MKNSSNLSISKNQAPVNSAPLTVTVLTCPSCRGERVAEINTGLPGKPLYAPCGGCGGSGKVEDGIGPATEGGFDVFVQGIYFWRAITTEAAETYNAETMSLEIERGQIRDIVQRREDDLRLWMAEFNAIEVEF